MRSGQGRSSQPVTPGNEEQSVQVLKDMVELQQELIASLIKEVYRLSDELQQTTGASRRKQPTAIQRVRPAKHLA